MERDAARLSVAILAGGQSRRMGRDKLLLPWDDGQILDRIIEVALSLTDPASAFVIGDRPAYHGRGATVVADRFPGCGPLGGIATALMASTEDCVLVLAGDMPLVNESLLRAMIEYETEADVLVPVREGAAARQPGRVTFETLHAIYRQSCLPAIERRIERGELALIGLFEEVKVEPLTEEWLRKWDPELRSFANANTPGDLERMRRDK